MERRKFIKNSCFACMALGSGISLLSLESCHPLPIVKTDPTDNKLYLDKSSFIEPNKTLLVRTPKLQYDILLVKNKENEYIALYTQCTHNDNPLTATTKGLVCNSHGSEFNFKGVVLNGPADKNLRTFPIEVTDQKIIILL